MKLTTLALIALSVCLTACDGDSGNGACEIVYVESVSVAVTD